MILNVLAGVVITIVLISGVFLFFIQDLALFHPNDSPDSWMYLTTRPEYKAVEFESNGKIWRGILRTSTSQGTLPLILFFYGNAQNAAGAMRAMDAYGVWPYFLDYSCLIVDYAGYGADSGSRPSAKKMYEGALAAFDYAKALSGFSRIIVGGYSIGTASAVYLAAHRKTDGLFLLAPFSNVYDMFNSVVPVFHGPLRLLVKHRFLSDEFAKSVTVPVLLVASRDDKLIPFALPEKLNKCFGGETSFVALSGVGHGEILFNQASLESVRKYLEKLQTQEKEPQITRIIKDLH